MGLGSVLMAVVKGTGDRPVGGAGCSQPLHSLLGAPTVLPSSVSPTAQGAPGGKVGTPEGTVISSIQADEGLRKGKNE